MNRKRMDAVGKWETARKSINAAAAFHAVFKANQSSFHSISVSIHAQIQWQHSRQIKLIKSNLIKID